jgi:hypothetical protein
MGKKEGPCVAGTEERRGRGDSLPESGVNSIFDRLEMLGEPVLLLAEEGSIGPRSIFF